MAAAVVFQALIAPAFFPAAGKAGAQMLLRGQAHGEKNNGIRRRRAERILLRKAEKGNGEENNVKNGTLEHFVWVLARGETAAERTYGRR